MEVGRDGDGAGRERRGVVELEVLVAGALEHLGLDLLGTLAHAGVGRGGGLAVDAGRCLRRGCEGGRGNSGMADSVVAASAIEPATTKERRERGCRIRGVTCLGGMRSISNLTERSGMR